MAQLHETRMGQQLITSTLPRIAKSLEQLVKQNEAKESKAYPDSSREEMMEKTNAIIANLTDLADGQDDDLGQFLTEAADLIKDFQKISMLQSICIILDMRVLLP